MSAEREEGGAPARRSLIRWERPSIAHLAGAGLAGLAVAWVLPYNSFVFRVLPLVSLALVAGSALLALRRRPLAAGTAGIALALPLGALLLPARAVDGEALHRRYLQGLERYEGVRYVWGGEDRFGIDCSGFVRRALIDAHVSEGVARANPVLLRRALSDWWFDASALALRDGYRGRTLELFRADSLNGMEHGRLAPGDLAVTADGVHVMAYLGSETWIEADPIEGRVVRIRVPEPRLPWFSQPVVLMRWADFGG